MEHDSFCIVQTWDAMLDQCLSCQVLPDLIILMLSYFPVYRQFSIIAYFFSEE